MFDFDQKVFARKGSDLYGLIGIIAHGRGWMGTEGKISKNSRKWHLLETRAGHSVK